MWASRVLGVVLVISATASRLIMSSQHCSWDDLKFERFALADRDNVLVSFDEVSESKLAAEKLAAKQEEHGGEYQCTEEGCKNIRPGRVPHAIEESMGIEIPSACDSLHIKVVPGVSGFFSALSQAVLRSNLVELELQYSAMNDSDTADLVKVLAEQPKLAILRLGSTHMGSEGMRVLSDMLKVNGHLHTLEIGSSRVVDADVAVLANALHHNNVLHTLALRHSDFGPAGAGSPPPPQQTTASTATLLLPNYSLPIFT